jgi:hypothetical protein
MIQALGLSRSIERTIITKLFTDVIYEWPNKLECLSLAGATN